MTALMARELYVVGIRLSAAPAAAGQSRTFVRRTLQNWQCHALVDDAELVVSELVTNAVKATGSAGAGIVGVQLRLTGGHLYVEVWDECDGSPVVAESADDYAESGRGLVLVGSGSEEWGVHRSTEGGKVVWAKLASAGAAVPPLPQESPRQPRAPHDDPHVRSAALGVKMRQADIALMRRVLDGCPRLPEPRFVG